MNYAYQEGFNEGYRKGYEDGMMALQERMVLNMIEHTGDDHKVEMRCEIKALKGGEQE